MGLKIYKTCCKNCLFSKDAIVSPKRRREIMTDCTRNQTHFICHKATQEGKDIVCRSFFDKLGHISQLIRIAGRMNAFEFVDQPEAEKLTTYNEMKK